MKYAFVPLIKLTFLLNFLKALKVLFEEKKTKFTHIKTIKSILNYLKKLKIRQLKNCDSGLRCIKRSSNSKNSYFSPVMFETDYEQNNDQKKIDSENSKDR